MVFRFFKDKSAVASDPQDSKDVASTQTNSATPSKAVDWEAASKSPVANPQLAPVEQDPEDDEDLDADELEDIDFEDDEDLDDLDLDDEDLELDDEDLEDEKREIILNNIKQFKNQKIFLSDLKTVYQAASLQVANHALDQLDKKFVDEMSEEDITLINELPKKVNPYEDLFNKVGVREKH